MEKTYTLSQLAGISSDIVALKLVSILYSEGVINDVTYRRIKSQYNTPVKSDKP